MAEYVHIVRVRGSLPFPVDMLRYDRCTPNAEFDSERIAASFDPGAGELHVEVRRVDPDPNWYPTRARWQSRGWTIIEIRREPSR